MGRRMVRQGGGAFAAGQRRQGTAYMREGGRRGSKADQADLPALKHNVACGVRIFIRE